MKKQRSGFACLSPDALHALCHKAGVLAHLKGVAREWTSEEAKVAGKRGGLVSAQRRRARTGSIGGPQNSSVQEADGSITLTLDAKEGTP